MPNKVNETAVVARGLARQWPARALPPIWWASRLRPSVCSLLSCLHIVFPYMLSAHLPLGTFSDLLLLPL